MATTNHEKAVRDAAAALNSAANEARQAGYSVDLTTPGGKAAYVLISETAKLAKQESKSPASPQSAGAASGAKTADK